jgi:hypothetical protein
MSLLVVEILKIGLFVLLPGRTRQNRRFTNHQRFGLGLEGFVESEFGIEWQEKEV